MSLSFLWAVGLEFLLTITYEYISLILLCVQMLMTETSSDESRAAAAIEIQRYARGYIVR